MGSSDLRFHLFVDGIQRFYWERGEDTPDHYFGSDDDQDGHLPLKIVEAGTAFLMQQKAKDCLAAFEDLVGPGILRSAAARPAESRLRLQLLHDELAASVASFLAQSVTLHALISDAEDFLHFVRDELAPLQALDHASKQRSQQVLYHALLAVRTPGDALQFLGCRRGPRAWQDVARGNLPHAWSEAETLFSMSLSCTIHYASQHTTGQEAPLAFPLSYDAPFAAALVSSIFKLQAAVFISKSPTAYDGYVSIYLKSASELLAALDIASIKKRVARRVLVEDVASS